MSPYFQAIREATGSALILVPTAGILPRDAGGRVLLAHEVDTQSWIIIGGAMEPGETPEEAARRECLEETGLEVELTGIETVVGGPRYEVTYPNGDRVAPVAVIFGAEIVGGELRPDGVEVDSVEWFAPPELGAARLSPWAANLLGDLGILPAALKLRPG